MVRAKRRGNSPRIYFRFVGWNWFSCGAGRMTSGVRFARLY
jgi:hypothetical protein